MSAALAAGCADRAVSPSTTRDSAGVTIVESAGPRWVEGSGWSIAAEPVLRIGAVEGDPAEQLFGVEAALRLPDGRIVVANGGTSEIRAFDAAGTHLWTQGGSGDAPGEYRSITGLGAGPGDSLWVYDFGLRRFTVLTGAGEVVRTVSLGGSLSAPNAVGRLPDGGFVVKEGWSGLQHASDQPGLSRLPVAIARFDPHGVGPDTLLTLPGREVYLGSENGRMVMSAPLFARDAAAALRDGRLIAGDRETFEVSVFSNGELVRIARLPRIDLSISRDDISAMKEAVLAGEPASERPMMSAHLDALDVPPTRPAYGDVLLDPDLNIWLGEHAPSSLAPIRWTVLAPDGELLGRIEAPDRLRILDVGRDYVLGLWRDDADVEYVMMHALTRTASP